MNWLILRALSITQTIDSFCVVVSAPRPGANASMVQTPPNLATTAPTSRASALSSRETITRAMALNRVAPNRVPAGQTVVIPSIGARLKSYNGSDANIHRVYPTNGSDSVVALPTGLITQACVQVRLVRSARMGRCTVNLSAFTPNLEVVPVTSTHMHRIGEESQEALSGLDDH